MTVELTEPLLAKLAGWEAMKQARDLLATGAVLRSDWQPPRLLGQVREGKGSYASGLIIRSATDADNTCPCHASRQRGLICAHAVAIGLHFLASRKPQHLSPSAPPAKQTPKVASPAGQASSPAARSTTTRQLQRARPGASPGQPLELFLILPPNFAEAIARSHVMLFLEASSHHERHPLSHFIARGPFALSPQDHAILEALEKLNDGETPTMVRLQIAQFLQLLPHLVGHPRVTLGKSRSIDISREPVRPAITASLQPTGEIQLRLAQPTLPGIIHGSPPWQFNGDSLQPVELPSGLETLLRQPLQLPRTDVPQFLLASWPQLDEQQRVHADFSTSAFRFDPFPPQFRLHLAGHLALLDATLACFYGDRSTADLSPEALWFPDPLTPTRYLARDPAAERAALARLLAAGFSHDPKGTLQLRGQDAILRFFAREFPRLEREWQVTLEERLQHTTEKHFDRLEPRFQITPSGEQWFDLHIDYQTRGGETLSTADLHRLLRSGQSHARLKNGKTLLVDSGAVEDLQQVLVDCAPQQHSGAYRLSNAQAGFLDATLRRNADWHINAPATWQNRAAQQRGEVKLIPPPLGDLDDVLRPYQKTGVAWLHFLREHGFGGILADEMGLGKTVQVLAHLDLSRNPALSNPLPNLVVCPTSLVHNWAAEARKFTPRLSTLLLHGPSRHEHFPQIHRHSLVITSYALLRRDASLYQEFEFGTVILDEAQHIKNRQTQNAQSVKSIRSHHRLVLTGTPIENSVLDLWSIFDFLMPGYLGAADDFKARYELPILRDRSKSAQERLARRLQPFLLRRLKRDVASDLPAKIEQVSTCELSDAQRAIYQQVLEQGRREILDSADPQSSAKNRMLVLTTLLRLRQICCDLRLLPVQPANPSTSGKLELFNELLEEILDGGHRVLVFSQFTQMLDLIRQDLAARNISFCYLDGATRNRAEVVDQFQNDHAIPVFLISLKAGGVGLNLTGADTVIHFDPWWNPAVEAQATDRAHRIGQRQIVTSYKLITRGTVEEKILNLQSRKRDLVQGLLGDEEQLTAALSWEEIQELLSE